LGISVDVCGAELQEREREKDEKAEQLISGLGCAWVGEEGLHAVLLIGETGARRMIVSGMGEKAA
jgi:hypothetical protein